MNVNTDKEIEMAGSPKIDHGHTHEYAEEKVHLEEEECALETDTRTVHLDQGMG